MKKMMVGIGISVAIALLLSIGVVGVTVADKLDGYTHDGTEDYEEYCLNAIQVYNKMIPEFERAYPMRDQDICYDLIDNLLDKIGRPDMGRGNPYIEDDVYDAYQQIRMAEGKLWGVHGSVANNYRWDRIPDRLEDAAKHMKNANELLGKGSKSSDSNKTPMVSVVGVILAMMVAIGVSKKKKKRS